MQNARKRYKRRSSKKVVTVRGRSRVPRGLDPYNGEATHCFKRFLDDAVVQCSGLGTYSILTSGGLPPPWAVLGVPFADAVGNTSQFGISVVTALNMVPGSSDFTTLFERFQIVKLVVTITPMVGDSFNAAYGSPVPSLLSVLDFNDAQVLGTAQQGLEHGTCKAAQMSIEHPFVRSCQPKPAALMYGAGPMTSAYASTSGPDDTWLDTTHAGAEHYGQKFYFRNFFTGAAANVYAFRIQPQIWFKLKGTA